MKKSYSLIIDDEFIQYCELNNIEDVEKFAKETFKKGFAVVKYGRKPSREETLDALKEAKERIKTDPEFAREIAENGRNAMENYMKAHTRIESNEIIPVIPLNPPDGSGLLSKMDKKSDIYDE